MFISSNWNYFIKYLLKEIALNKDLFEINWFKVKM